MDLKTVPYNRIVIVQSLNEWRTGTRLQEDLNTLSAIAGGVVRVVLTDVASRVELMSLLNELNTDVQKNGVLPLIHFETHGAKDSSGLILTSGECISWQDLKLPLTNINMSMKLNLLVTLSACYGAGLVEVIQPVDRAPCWGLVGPGVTMNAEDLLHDFTRYFDVLIKTNNGEAALNVLNRELYYYTSAERYFEEVWIRHIRDGCSKESLAKRATGIINKAKQIGDRNIPNKKVIMGKIMREQPAFFRRTVKKFFMIDLFPDNITRFTPNYDAVMREAKGNMA